jgi:SAM-dependent methyltransferase
MNCCCCALPMRRGLDDWHWVCARCAHESAVLTAAINAHRAEGGMDELLREAGLRSLRERNFNTLLALMDRQLPARERSLLDIGAAHGWFVRMASDQWCAEGLEPDAAICQRARDAGVPVRTGYFPDALKSDERFDALVFNDVFEHIPDVGETLLACRRHLRDGGIIVINLPSSRGTLYRMAKFLRRCGMPASFERLWQKDLPSPHVHYFCPTNLAGLLRRYGYEPLESARLVSVSVRGLYQRVAYAKNQSFLANLCRYFVMLMAIPVLGLSSSDAVVVIARLQCADAGGQPDHTNVAAI